MKILWDEPKRRANLDKHGLDFADIAENFDFETAIVRPAKPSQMRRERFQLIGSMYGDLLVALVASPLGAEALSIISLRPASKEERDLYASEKRL